jgi:hypothetical protein
MFSETLFFGGMIIGLSLMYFCMGVTILKDEVKIRLRMGNLSGELPVKTSPFFFTISGFDLIVIREHISSFKYVGVPELSDFKHPFVVKVVDLTTTITWTFNIDPNTSSYTLDDNDGISASANSDFSQQGTIRSIFDLTNIIANPADQE